MVPVASLAHRTPAVCDPGNGTQEGLSEPSFLEGEVVGEQVPERWEEGVAATVMEPEVRGVRAGNGAGDGAGIDLYWLPLGAGGRSVRLNGRVFEAVQARLERLRPLDLYHSALEVGVPEGRFVIEMTPIADADGARAASLAARQQRSECRGPRR